MCGRASRPHVCAHTATGVAPPLVRIRALPLGCVPHADQLWSSTSEALRRTRRCCGAVQAVGAVSVAGGVVVVVVW
jgi:hypothetical protein